jgi:DNA-binding transcriptional regulator YiaG
MNEHGTAFVHAGAGAAKPFHYTQCGLDDVWLLNGFTLSDTAYGPAFSIKDMDVLHKAIGLALVRGRKTFGGKDVRFLRRQMQLTQNQLGALIGVGDQMVARYEKEESHIPEASAMLLRWRYLTTVLDDDETVRDLKRLLADMEATANAAGPARKPLYLKATRGRAWKVAAV